MTRETIDLLFIADDASHAQRQACEWAVAEPRLSLAHVGDPSLLRGELWTVPTTIEWGER